MTVALGASGNYVFLLARSCFGRLTDFRRLGSMLRMMIPIHGASIVRVAVRGHQSAVRGLQSAQRAFHHAFNQDLWSTPPPI
ncbi:MAG: hypothetical protein ACPGPS_08990 [Rubripirellula sp.]